ncbi:FUSC family protein [Amycolatopsis jiangsuensis]|uniref:Putative membrane protein YccC n=1 Tax=Amycolatopsis jiangsuensis TaxID=1181879 RepID=A0A840IYF3_9PSEU|nr:FUSC family protein [Amycolatopsis jiangsuensis]MBB4686870.1 putative membrane protein YccC [Amycolatopsis jiangsuensis]
MSRPDFAAPHWLVQLLRPKQVPVPWNMVIRAAISLATPLAVAYALGDIAVGALMSTGALPVVLSEAAGTYRYRARRLGGSTVAAAGGYLIGLLTGGMPAWSVPAVVLVAAVSALISAAGSNASVAALQMFVFCVLGTAQHATGLRVEVLFGYFCVGAVWALLVALVTWTVRATSPERSAVAQVYIELAAMLSATDEPTSRVARHQLTTAMSTAYDRLLIARSWLSGRDATYRRLLNRLSAATPAVEAAVAMVNAGRRAPDEVIDYLTGVAASVLAAQPLAAPPELPEQDPDPLSAALYTGLKRIEQGDDRQRREPVSPLRRVRQWAGSLISGPLTWLVALRLTVCVAVAEVVALLVPFERSYWITLTVGVVLKPDFGSVFGRAVLRGLGTVAGVGIGAVVLAVGARGWVLVVLIAAFAGGAAVGKVRNYGMLGTFVTPLIILQMDLARTGSWPVVLARLVDTVTGCLIVLVIGYLLWPGSRRPQVGGRLADSFDEVASYVRAAMVRTSTNEARLARSRARRAAYRALADLRTAFQQVIVEPSPAGRQAVAWWPVIAGLERVTDAVTEVGVTIGRGTPSPSPADIELVTAALAELATAVREQRDPDSMPMPDNPRLAGVADQLGSTFDAVRGPDLVEQSPLRLMRRFLPYHRRT